MKAKKQATEPKKGVVNELNKKFKDKSQK